MKWNEARGPIWLNPGHFDLFPSVHPGVCPAGNPRGRRDAGEVLQREPAHHQRKTHPPQHLHQVQDPQVSTRLNTAAFSHLVIVTSTPEGVACYRTVLLRVEWGNKWTWQQVLVLTWKLCSALWHHLTKHSIVQSDIRKHTFQVEYPLTWRASFNRGMCYSSWIFIFSPLKAAVKLNNMMLATITRLAVSCVCFLCDPTVKILSYVSLFTSSCRLVYFLP